MLPLSTLALRGSNKRGRIARAVLLPWVSPSWTEFTGSPNSPSLFLPCTEACCSRPNLPCIFLLLLSTPPVSLSCLGDGLHLQPEGEVVLQGGKRR